MGPLRNRQPLTSRGLRVLVAGGNGVLGWRVIRDLVSRGHDVHALVRKESAAALVRGLGATPHTGDLLTGLPVDTLPDRVDVIVHAATAIPVNARPSRAEWLQSDRVRLDGTRVLAEWGASRGIRLFVLPSTVWVARPGDGAPFDEGEQPNPTEFHQSAADAESLVRELAGSNGFEAAIMRFGWYYGADVPHTTMFRDLLARGRLPIVGDGEAYWSVIHLDDAASAVGHAVEGLRGGLWHVIDDEPVPIAEFLGTFASLLGAPRPRRVPHWLARAVAGSYSTEFLTLSTLTSNARFKAEFAWQPKYPDSRQGLRQVVEEWSASDVHQEQSAVRP